MSSIISRMASRVSGSGNTAGNAALQCSIMSARRENIAKWKESTEEFIERYRAEYTWLTTMDARLAQKYVNNARFMKLQKIGFNFLRMVVRELAKIYSIPPERVLYMPDGEQAKPEVQKLFDDLAEASGLNTHLARANEYSELLNGVMIYCLPNVADGIVDVGHVVGAALQVVQDPFRPQSLQACREVSWPAGGNSASVGTDASPTYYLRFFRGAVNPETGDWDKVQNPNDPVHFTITDAGGKSLGDYDDQSWVVAMNDAGWTKFPLVLALTMPAMDADLVPDLPWDLFTAQEFFDDELTRGGLNTWFADMPLTIHSGTKEDWGQQSVASPGGILHTGSESSTVTNLTRDPREATRMANIREHAALIGTERGIPGSIFRGATGVETGISQHYNNLPFIMAMRQKQSEWVKTDQEVCSLGVIPCAVVLDPAKYGILDGCYVRTEWAPFQVPAPLSEQASAENSAQNAKSAKWQFDLIRLASGAMSVYEWAAEWAGLTTEQVDAGELRARMAAARAEGIPMPSASGEGGSGGSGGGDLFASFMGGGASSGGGAGGSGGGA